MVPSGHGSFPRRRAAVPVGFSVRLARGRDAGARAAVARGAAPRGGAADRAPLGDPGAGGDRAPRARKAARPPPRTRRPAAAGARPEVRLVALGRGSRCQAGPRNHADHGAGRLRGRAQARGDARARAHGAGVAPSRGRPVLRALMDVLALSAGARATRPRAAASQAPTALIGTLTPRFAKLPAAQRRLWPRLRPSVSLGFVLYGGTAVENEAQRDAR